eukprot:6423528-Prymnesium_polylepis.1
MERECTLQHAVDVIGVVALEAIARVPPMRREEGHRRPERLPHRCQPWFTVALVGGTQKGEEVHTRRRRWQMKLARCDGWHESHPLRADAKRIPLDLAA